MRWPTAYICFSLACPWGIASFMPLDCEEIQATRPSMFFCSSLPNGVAAILAASRPCRVCMQVSRRDSRSCTLLVSAK
ncbi:hypothetical protein D3C78_1615540 [compost metagenome]